MAPVQTAAAAAAEASAAASAPPRASGQRTGVGQRERVGHRRRVEPGRVVEQHPLDVEPQGRAADGGQPVEHADGHVGQHQPVGNVRPRVGSATPTATATSSTARRNVGDPAGQPRLRRCRTTEDAYDKLTTTQQTALQSRGRELRLRRQAGRTPRRTKYFLACDTNDAKTATAVFLLGPVIVPGTEIKSASAVAPGSSAGPDPVGRLAAASRAPARRTGPTGRPSTTPAARRRRARSRPVVTRRTPRPAPPARRAPTTSRSPSTTP